MRSLRHIEAYFAQAEARLLQSAPPDAPASATTASRRSARRTGRALYPKVDAAWTFTQLRSATRTATGWLSYGKLRAAYGETGREPPVYATISALSSTALFGSGFGDFIGTDAERPGRARHRRQRSATRTSSPSATARREVGIDLGFCDQRVGRQRHVLQQALDAT